MPALIRELAVSGSRKSDGTANASGKVFLYSPGTTTLVAGYQDDSLSEAWTTSGGGIPLDAGGRVKIWINDMIDVVVTDADGATVDTMLGYNKTRAEQVEVENDAYTGNVTDSSGAVTQGLGGKTDLDAVLTAAATSLGDDFKFKESTGADSRTYITVIGEQRVSVKDFGAVGNGIADDTTACQEALTRGAARGGGKVYFPAGTYKTSSLLSLTSASGVSVVGDGPYASKIITSAGVNALGFTSCSGFRVEDIGISAVGTNGGSAVALSGCVSVTMSSVRVSAFGGGTFLIPLVFSASCTTVRVDNCDLTDKSGDTASRTIKLTDTSNVLISGGYINSNSGAAIEFAGSTGNAVVAGVSFTAGTGSPTGVLFTSGLSGLGFKIFGCPGLRAGLGRYSKPFDMSALATDPYMSQWGNDVDGYTTDLTSGGTFTPDRAKGYDIRVRGTTTGSPYVINAPTPTPSAVSSNDGQHANLQLTFYNNAGGAVSGWNLNAAYHKTAGVSVTDGDITVIIFRWDPSTNVWREMSRAVTA